MHCHMPLIKHTEPLKQQGTSGKTDKGRDTGFAGGERSGESSHRSSGAGHYMGCYHGGSLSSPRNSGNRCST